MEKLRQVLDIGKIYKRIESDLIHTVFQCPDLGKKNLEKNRKTQFLDPKIFV